MNDPFPQEIEFEIEREKLRAYLRAKWFLLLFSGTFAFGFFFFGVFPILEKALSWEAARYVGRVGVAALATGLLFAVVADIAYVYWYAARLSRSLRVRVEGPYLRLIQETHTRTDSKLHFRSIVDYATVEGPLMRRFGIMALRMTSTVGGLAQPGRNCLELYGVKDPEAVREMLSEIDRLRERESG